MNTVNIGLLIGGVNSVWLEMCPMYKIKILNVSDEYLWRVFGVCFSMMLIFRHRLGMCVQIMG